MLKQKFQDLRSKIYQLHVFQNKCIFAKVIELKHSVNKSTKL